MNVKTKFLICSMLVMSGVSFGQALKFTALGGYTVQDKVYGYYGDVILGGGAHFSGSLAYEKSANMAIEFTYNRQQTTFNIKDYSSIIGTTGNYSGSINYYMLGVKSSPDFTAQVAPYGGFMMGAAVIAPSEKFDSETRFAVGGKLGVVYHASDKVGIVLQAQLLVPVQGVGLGVGCGTGGCGGGAYTSSTATQLGFSGGLEIKLKD